MSVDFPITKEVWFWQQCSRNRAGVLRKAMSGSCTASTAWSTGQKQMELLGRILLILSGDTVTELKAVFLKWLIPVCLFVLDYLPRHQGLKRRMNFPRRQWALEACKNRSYWPMGALAGVFTEMVQQYGSCSSSFALHCFWSPRLEMGNLTWVLSALECCGPAAKEIHFPDMYCNPSTAGFCYHV